jgi:uncharacterized membrane protein
MEIQKIKKITLPILLALPLVACNSTTEKVSTAPPSTIAQDVANSEQELALQAKAYQRTIAEGVGTGAVVGTLLGTLTNNTKGGFTIGVGAGALSGTYVAALQQKYISKERKLEKVRDDINAANAQLAASIATMQVVLDLQTGQLAALRSQAGSNETLSKEITEAETNLTNMRTAVDGAGKWKEEFQSTRSLKLVENQLTGVDSEIALLSERIEAMRAISDTLAATI